MPTGERPPLKVDLTKFSPNEGYELGDNKGASFAKRATWMFVNALVFRPSFLPLYGLKARLLRAFGARVGEGVIFKPGIHVNRPWNLTIGDHCWIGEAVWLDCTSELHIGSHVVVSQGAFLCCGMHDWQDPGMGSIAAPITVEDGAWIASFARIAGNVTIGQEAVIAMGSVVFTDCEVRGTYRGNPARKIGIRRIRNQPGPPKRMTRPAPPPEAEEIPCVSYEPATHYDKVTAAWTLLLGEELHYGVFDTSDEELGDATGRLTELMLEASRIERTNDVLDVGCGTGAPACRIASDTGAQVTGITTSEEGLAAARERAGAAGLTESTAFELRDGMDNGFPDGSFDRVWVLESSHLMRRRDALISECSRVLRPSGRIALCDIVRRRELDLAEVRRLRKPLALLRRVYGDARMEPLAEYGRLMRENGLAVDLERDLTAQTRPTFDGWRANAERHHDQVVELIGADELARFLESCDVLERFWDDGTLGYGLIAAAKS